MKRLVIISSLILIMAVTFVGCGDKGPNLVTGSAFATLTPVPGKPTATPTPTPVTSVVLKDVADISVSKNETGADITVKLKKPITFENGQVLDADWLESRIIAALYEEYKASIGFRPSEQLPAYSILCKENIIVGLTESVHFTTAENITATEKLFDEIYAGSATATDEWTLQEYAEAVNFAWEEAAKAIIYNCLTNFADYADQGYMGAYTKADLSNEKLQVAYTMCMWGFGEFEENSKIFVNTRGDKFDTAAGNYPELADFVEEVQYLYSNDAKDFYEKEVASSDKVTLLERAKSRFVFMKSTNVVSSVYPHVMAGIQKADEATLVINLTGNVAENIKDVFTFVISQ